MKNVTELTKVLARTIDACDKGTVDVKGAKLVFAGSKTIMDVMKKQMTYSKLRKEKVNIPFMKRG